MAHCGDHDPHVREVVEHLGVRETQDSKPQSPEHRIAVGVGCRLIRVVGAVDLDHHSRFDATEIDDVPCEDMLTSEVKAVKSVVAKSSPELSFGRRRLTPQFSGSGKFLRRGSW